MDMILGADTAAIFWIQNHLVHPWLTPWMIGASSLGDLHGLGIIWCLLAGVLIYTRKYRRVGIAVILALLFCLVVGDLALKNLIMRAPLRHISTCHRARGRRTDELFLPVGAYLRRICNGVGACLRRAAQHRHGIPYARCAHRVLTDVSLRPLPDRRHRRRRARHLLRRRRVAACRAHPAELPAHADLPV